MRILSFTLLILLITLGIGFALLNAEPVTVNYFLGEREWPLSLLLLTTLTLGCILTFIAQLKVLLQYRYKIHELKKKLSLSSQEINHLRVLPVRDVEP